MIENYKNKSYDELCEIRDNLDRKNNQELYSELVQLIFERRNEKTEKPHIIDDKEKPKYTTHFLFVYMLKYSFAGFSLIEIFSFIQTLIDYEAKQND